MARCLANVFTSFPPERTKLLASDELHDVQINLHAFVMNVYGSFDNIAWVYMLEQGRENTLDRRAIGLFNKRTQVYLSQRMRDHLTAMGDWHADYAKNYRDALAHRIPLYVPPFTVTDEEHSRWQELDAQILPAIRAQEFDRSESLKAERDAIGTICGAFLHSFSDSDGRRSVLLHPQLLSDSLTVAQLIETVIADVKASGWGSPA